MKKNTPLLSSLWLLCVFAASCSSKEPPRIEPTIPKPQTYSAAVDTPGKGSAKSKPQKNSKASDAVDIDLTAMSGTMVYATVYKIMSKPKDYIGKTIRARGPYSAIYFEETGLHYHFVVIEDATACCKQGFEFVWKGNHAYPADYPAEETKIEVAGTFKSYEELGKTYYHLVVDEVALVQK
jgi:hypothetical protein